MPTSFDEYCRLGPALSLLFIPLKSWHQRSVMLFSCFLSPAANPDNSNISFFMSVTNHMDLDLIWISGGHAETDHEVTALGSMDADLSMYA